MREERDGSRFRMDVTLRQIHIVVVGLANDRYLSLKPVVLQHELFLVLSSLLRHEKEDHLGDLTNFQNALALANAEVVWHGYLPLSGLFADVTNDDRLFGFVLDWHKSEIKLIGEVKHCAATSCADGHNELLAFGHHHQIVSVVRLGLRGKLDYVGDVHTWGDLG